MRIFAAVKASLVYFELLTRYYGFGQCSDILPLQKNLIFTQIVFLLNSMFSLCSLFFTIESKKNQLITKLSKNFELFAGLNSRQRSNDKLRQTINLLRQTMNLLRQTIITLLRIQTSHYKCLVFW